MSTVYPIRGLVVIALFCVAALPASRATLLVYEGFDGYAAGQLSGQAPNANTIGLKTNVYYDNGSTDRSANYTLTTGLTFGSLVTNGGALAFTTTTNVIGANIAATAYTGTLWSSYLVRLDTVNNSGINGAVIRIGESGPADATSSHFSSWADSRNNGSAKVAVGYAAGSTSIDASTELATGTTYLVINSFTRVGQTLNSTTPGVATTWVFTEAQYATFLAAGGDETALGTASVTATATHSVTSSIYTFNSNRSIGIVTVGDSGVYDELRYASTLADVIPTAVPEPTSTALIMGLAALAGWIVWRPRS